MPSMPSPGDTSVRHLKAIAAFARQLQPELDAIAIESRRALRTYQHQELFQVDTSASDDWPFEQGSGLWELYAALDALRYSIDAATLEDESPKHIPGWALAVDAEAYLAHKAGDR